MKAVRARDNERLEEVNGMGSLEQELRGEFREDVIDAAISLGIPLEDIEETYMGHYDSDVDFAEHWVEYLYGWDAFAEDLMNDFVKKDGHYFEKRKRRSERSRW